MAKVKAVLFDMDGLVLDTEKLYTRFWQEAAKAHGYPMTREQALGMRSLNRGAGAAKLASYFGEGVDYDAIRKTRIGLMEAFIEEEGVEVKPGLEVLLSYLKEQDIKNIRQYLKIYLKPVLLILYLMKMIHIFL